MFKIISYITFVLWTLLKLILYSSLMASEKKRRSNLMISMSEAVGNRSSREVFSIQIQIIRFRSFIAIINSYLKSILSEVI